MRSTNLAFDNDYMEFLRLSLEADDFDLFQKLTDDYVFKCDNYAVAYNLLRILDHIPMCEHSQMVDDCFWPYSWLIFITCRPQDIGRIKYTAKNIPSSIEANIKIYDSNEEEI